MNNQEAKKILQRDLIILIENKSLPDGIEAMKVAIYALGAIEQIRWERDVAVSQLEELGLSLGQKVDHVKDEEAEDEEDDEEDIMIRASRKAHLSRKKLIDTYESSGLMGVYNLGLKNMLDYLGR